MNSHNSFLSFQVVVFTGVNHVRNTRVKYKCEIFRNIQQIDRFKLTEAIAFLNCTKDTKKLNRAI